MAQRIEEVVKAGDELIVVTAIVGTYRGAMAATRTPGYAHAWLDGTNGNEP